MPSDEPSDAAREPWRFSSASTVIFNRAEQAQIAVLEFPLWIPEGSVIELGSPNRDAVVIGVRFALSGSKAAPSIIVDVRELDEGEFIPRDVGDRILREE